MDWQHFWTEKKPKSDLGFKPGLPRQNAIVLPLVPPPLPLVQKRDARTAFRNLELFCYLIDPFWRILQDQCQQRCSSWVSLVAWAPIKKQSQVRKWWVWKSFRCKAEREEDWEKVNKWIQHKIEMKTIPSDTINILIPRWSPLSTAKKLDNFLKKNIKSFISLVHCCITLSYTTTGN